MSSISLAPLLLLSTANMTGNIKITKPSEVFYYFQEAALVVELPVKPGERVEKGQTLLKYRSSKEQQTKSMSAQESGYVEFIITDSVNANESIQAGSLASIVSSSEVLAIVGFSGSQYERAKIADSLWLCLDSEALELTVTGSTGKQLLTTFELPSYNNKILEIEPKKEINLHFDKSSCLSLVR
ncbi:MULTISPECIES: hypothetical protein [unclassified Pseudoalteromonas]|uniref:hypothetical protein n=1 Tax=unclassified Pseudoalteromonas TaxID=194690 RepID=UPI003014EC67